MISAWATDNRLVLGQEAVDEKSNEITAIPKLLALLELKGCLVTLDAMGCQREIAAQIVEQGGNYVLSLKGNQGALHETVKDFDTASIHNYAHLQYDFKEEIAKGHGHLEIRRYWITQHLDTLPSVEKWKGLASIGMVERTCWIGEKQTCRRYFVNSIAADAKRFSEAVREHWSIENHLHWRLDVLFHEDHNRIRKGNAPTIMAKIRHLCLGLFDLDSTTSNLAKKRRKASWNDRYRAKIVFGKMF